MAQTTMTTVDGILKEVYETQIRDQLQSEITTLKRIESTTEGVTSEVGGKYVTFPIRTKRSQGIGARRESELLPTARPQGYVPARVSLTYQYGTLELTGQVISLADKNFQAFASALDQDMESIRETLRKDTNRQVYGTSTGKLATATSGSTTTFVCTDAEAIYLEVGMIVDVYTSGDALKNNAMEIQSIVSSAGSSTVTMTAAGTAMASGDYLVRDDNRTKEIIGWREIVATSGTLYNVDPSTTPIWKAEVDDPGSGRALSEGLMISMADRIRKNGGKTTAIFTSLGVRRSYFNLLVQQRRYTNTQQFEGGFSGLAFTTDWGDIPVVSDFDCPVGHMFFMNEKELKLYQESEWSWMDFDGSMWQRVLGAPIGGGVVGTYDAYTATMAKYFQLGTHRRNSHGVIKNITEG